MQTFWQDVRYGLRQLVAERGFSVPAILTLTLGIGAAATLFTVVNAVLLKELPYTDPARLVILRGTFADQGKVDVWPISLLDCRDWRERATLFSQLSLWGSKTFNLEQGQQSQRLSAELVNADYFEVLGLAPELGRFFSRDEDAQPYERYVVVLGHHLWRSSFGADRKVLGRRIQLNTKTYEVIGVGPPGFRGLSDREDIWIPSMLPPVMQYHTDRSLRWANAVARLRPGVSVPQAQAQMDSVTAALAQEFPQTNRGFGAEVVPLDDFWFGKLRHGLLLLTIGAGLLLLIACIDVANLLLTRAAAKQRARAIRIALGADRLRLIRQLLTESILLALVGAVAGLLLAHWSTRALIAASGTELPSFVRVTTEPRVIAAIVGLAALCGLVFGLAPIATSFRRDLTRSLGRDEKQEPPGRGWRLVQGSIVVAQVALALTVSVCAVLMAKGFYKRIHEDLGFRADGLLTFRMDVRNPLYFDDRLAAQLVREKYHPRIAAIPGIERVAMSVPTIPGDDWSGDYVTIEDHDSEAPDGTYFFMIHAVSPDYFDNLGIPILVGRGFNQQDVETNAVIVSRALAEQQWPGQDPLGKRLKIGARGDDIPWLTVVGVAAPVHHEGLRDERPPSPEIYVSLWQRVMRPFTVNFLVLPKPGVSTAELRAPLRREMRAINPEIPAYDVATMAERLDRQMGRARFLVILISIFALLALVLAAIGIYGVISYGVAQRTREIAIRMSLGATRRSILGLVVGRGAVLALLGLALGLLAVFSLSGLLAGLLYQTDATDPLILGGTSLGLLVVTLLANYLPARRAAILDPVVVLRFQ